MTLITPMLGMLLLGVVLSLGTLVVGIEHGKAQATAACAAREQAAVTRAITQANALADEDAAILRATAATRATARRHAHTRTTQAATHVAKNPDLYALRLDACGLCLARSAARDTDPAACACGADGAVPAVIRAGGNDEHR